MGWERTTVFKQQGRGLRAWSRAESGRCHSRRYHSRRGRKGTGVNPVKVLLGHLWGLLLLLRVRRFWTEKWCDLSFKIITGALLGIFVSKKLCGFSFCSVFSISKKSFLPNYIFLKREYISVCLLLDNKSWPKPLKLVFTLKISRRTSVSCSKWWVAM